MAINLFPFGDPFEAAIRRKKEEDRRRMEEEKKRQPRLELAEAPKSVFEGIPLDLGKPPEEFVSRAREEIPTKPKYADVSILGELKQTMARELSRLSRPIVRAGVEAATPILRLRGVPEPEIEKRRKKALEIPEEPVTPFGRGFESAYNIALSQGTLAAASAVAPAVLTKALSPIASTGPVGQRLANLISKSKLVRGAITGTLFGVPEAVIQGDDFKKSLRNTAADATFFALLDAYGQGAIARRLLAGAGAELLRQTAAGEKIEPTSIAGMGLFMGLAGARGAPVENRFKDAELTLGLSGKYSKAQATTQWKQMLLQVHPDIVQARLESEKIAAGSAEYAKAMERSNKVTKALNEAHAVLTGETPPDKLRFEDIRKWADEVIAKFRKAPVPITPQLPAEIPSKIPPAEAFIEPKIPPERTSITPEIPIAEPKPPRLTTTALTKEIRKETFNNLLQQSTSTEDFAKRVNTIKEKLDQPEVKNDRRTLKQIRALATDQIGSLTGEPFQNYKQNYGLLQSIRGDPEMGPAIDSLLDTVVKIDDLLGPGKVRKNIEVAEAEMGLPAEGKYYIPYGKYTTRGTMNREWVQQNVPLIYMGNKRQMVGYYLNVLDIKEKDLGKITSEDTKHLNRITRVYDVFGGSGLLTNISKKFFNKAKFTYNELDADVIKALQNVKKNPAAVNKHIAAVGRYIHENPGADWLSHFKLVFKEDPNFQTAAKLIEAAAGRTQELTPAKLTNLVKAVPNFSKVFSGVTMTNEDAFTIIDKLIAKGSSKDLVIIDPPYLWSEGYAHGAEMERTSGFLKLLDKLEKLDEKGVGFVFFNNDPEIQVKKAGLESVHLDNIMSRLNRLTKDMVVLHGIKPIGTAREEIMITNLPEAKKSFGLLVQKEVEKRLEELFKDPATAPKEMLKLWRELRATSRFLPEGERITSGQISRIRELRRRLHIKNREMIPVLDELLGDISFAKMTKEDGERLLEWLKPQNFDIIEDRIRQVREASAEEKRVLAVGKRVVPMNLGLEDKYGAIEAANKTIDDIERLANVMRRLPKPKKIGWGRQWTGAKLAEHIPQEIASDILGIMHQFQIPLNHSINIPQNYVRNLSEWWDKLFNALSREEATQLIYLQSGAEKYYKGEITPKARSYSKYFQEAMDADFAIKDRLNFASTGRHLNKRKPYIAWVLDENLRQAAEFSGHGISFWEKRMHTPADFAAGLHSKDIQYIKEAFIDSTKSWMRKAIYRTFVQPTVDDLFDVSKPSGMYAKAAVESEIFDILPTAEKIKSAASIDDGLKRLFPKKVKVDKELISVLNNSLISSRIKITEDGTIELPRLKISGLHNNVVPLVYASKLGGINISYMALQVAQTASMIPLTGFGATLKSIGDTIGLIMPRNKSERRNYSRYLELAGYEYMVMLGGNKYELPQKQWAKLAWNGWNYLSIKADKFPRLAAQIGGEKLLKKLEGFGKMDLSDDDRKRFGAAFSAITNFLGGRGYAPLSTRKSFPRKLFYIFGVWPMKQLHLIGQYINTIRSDKNFTEFMAQIADYGMLSDKAYEYILKQSPKLRVNLAQSILRLAAMLSAGVAILYGATLSWNVAERGIVNINLEENMFLRLFTDFIRWINNPNDETEAELKKSWGGIFKPTSFNRLADVLSVYNYGLITTASGKPIFVDQNLFNYWRLAGFGRSALPQYEEAYSGALGKYLGGQTLAGDIEKAQRERSKELKQNKQNAVKIYKLLIKGDEKKFNKFIADIDKKGELREELVDSLVDLLVDKMTGKTILSQRFTQLNDRKQAELVFNLMSQAKDEEELMTMIDRFERQGILTDNVWKEMASVVSGK